MSEQARDNCDRYTLECVFKTTRNEPLTESLAENQIMVWLHEESGIETRLLKSIIHKDVKPNMIRVTFDSPCNCFQAMFQVRQQIDRIRNRRGVTRLAYYIDVRCLEWSLLQAMAYPMHDKFWPIYPKFDKDFRKRLNQHAQILRMEWVEFASSREKLNIAKIYMLVKGSAIDIANLKIFGLKFLIVDERVYRRGKEYIRQLFDFSGAPVPPYSPGPSVEDSELRINNEIDQGSPKRLRSTSWYAENGNCSFKPDEPPLPSDKGRNPSDESRSPPLGSPPGRGNFKTYNFRLGDEGRDFPSTSPGSSNLKPDINMRVAKRKNTSVLDNEENSVLTPASPVRSTFKTEDNPRHTKRRNATDADDGKASVSNSTLKPGENSRTEKQKMADADSRVHSHVV